MSSFWLGWCRIIGNGPSLLLWFRRFIGNGDLLWQEESFGSNITEGSNYTNCFRVSIVQGHSITSDSNLVSVNRSFICKSNIWITHNSLDLSFISSRFFIEKTGDDAKNVIISRGHIKLKVRRGHSFALPSEFAEGTVNCRIVELAAILENKS